MMDIASLIVHDHIVNVVMRQNSQTLWVLFVLYASSKVALHLWKYIKSIGDCLQVPWLFMGDWNQVL